MRSISRRGVIRAVSYTAAAFLILVGCCISIYRSSLIHQRTIANSYKRAFSQVVSSVDRIDSAMQKELYILTPAMVTFFSGQIQSEAATAQQALGELPYANIELENTAAFLSKVADYAGAISRSATANGGLSEEESKNLELLSKAASQLKERLQALEIQLNEEETSLNTVEEIEARLSQLTQGDDVLAGSTFENVETNFPEIPTMTYDGPFSDHLASAKPKMLEGREAATEQDALALCARATGLRESVFEVTGTVNGEIPCITLTAAVDGGTLSAYVTKAGGQLLGLSNSRAVGEHKLTPDQAAQQATAFLTNLGYESMEETYRYQTDGRITINYAYRQEDVLCYPDLVGVTVALDNGAIVGFESTSYLSNHTRRTLSVPGIPLEDARSRVSPRLTVLKEQLALIPTDGKYEVLCWEFICEAENGQHYVVCINAATGAEQKILILLEDENGTLAV